jgi:hypothetical protein
MKKRIFAPPIFFVSTNFKKLDSIDAFEKMCINAFRKIFFGTFSICLLDQCISKILPFEIFQRFSKNSIFINELQKSIFDAFKKMSIGKL